jgi:hypothetical protein
MLPAKVIRICMLRVHPSSVTFLEWRFTHTFEIGGFYSGGAEETRDAGTSQKT